MSEYWNRRFAQEGMSWGSEPSPTAMEAKTLFRKNNVRSVLVPGAGYGRNTKVFSNEFETIGIELSGAALGLAVEWDPACFFISGSVLDCNLETKVDAIYCYDLLHLFLYEDRRRLVSNCLDQLHPGGLLYFTSFSDEDPNYGCGACLEPATYEYKEGKYAHFFSEADLKQHFEHMEIIKTGTYIETLRDPQGSTRQYVLRSIFARKLHELPLTW
ncbi:class I SAM-dependent methyltransferase [Paenibacillus odorifer]|uniref:SAM-dependent methyltransferase n=1 Tax=Paenibacillus odorifer TaxID=189426 RepID=A0A1R0XVF0_9BACL|nr:class I SAM-dependent methyltransferase [Paenibacillus odorifer]OMD39085.1 SAM-dependent methyltransferase [Paenibacillus odorifer]